MAPAGKLSLILIPVLAIILGVGHLYLDWNVLSYLPWSTSTNGNGPRTFQLSDDPLVVYIKDFITPEEASHLVQLA